MPAAPAQAIARLITRGPVIGPREHEWNAQSEDCRKWSKIKGRKLKMERSWKMMQLEKWRARRTIGR